MNTTQSYLSYIVNLIAFQIFLYIYLSSQPKPKSKEKTNSKTIQPFLQSKTSNSSTRSIPRLEEKKKKRKFQKLVKKKKKLKANHLSLPLTKPRDTVRVRVKIVGQGTERIGASIPLYPPLNGVIQRRPARFESRGDAAGI